LKSIAIEYPPSTGLYDITVKVNNNIGITATHPQNQTANTR